MKSAIGSRFLNSDINHWITPCAVNPIPSNEIPNFTQNRTMQTSSVTFRNKQDIELSARLELPVDQKPEHFAIFAHCFTCGKNSKAATVISRQLTRNGFGVLRFDFTGLGESEGAFSDTGFTSNIADLVSAGEFLKEKYIAPALLIGHSLGGTAVIHAAAEMDSIKAVCTIGAPFEAKHVMHLVEGSRKEIQEKGKADVSLGGRTFSIGADFITDLENHLTADLLPELRKPLLVMHAPQDQVVGIENAEKIYKAAYHPKSFISLDGADHLLLREADAKYCADVLASWSCRYLPEIPESALTTDEDVAVQLGEFGFTTEIVAGQHYLLADEPRDVGGNDLGPTPYQLLNAALGACTAMTLKMYAERKKWPLEEVTVHLTHSKRYGPDSAEPENEDSKIEYFKRILEIKGKLDESQIKRLMEIADKCPVHRTLTERELKINTILRS